MFIGQMRGCFFVEHLCFCAVISSRACSSAWLERIPDKDEAGGSSPPRPTSSTLESGGISSAGRAPALQAGGQRFDPAILHQALMFTAWSNEWGIWHDARFIILSLVFRQ